MSVGIIDYGAGNLRSLSFSLERLGVDAFVSSDPQQLRTADRIIFPGVGAAAHAMRQLEASGLDDFIRSYERPLLGICLGMQLLCLSSAEGDVPCLGIFSVAVARLQGDLKIPHTGWNTLEKPSGALFNGIAAGAFMYFVHSYAAPLCQHTAARTTYPAPFSAALQLDNYYAVQFHPEKSGLAGERLLQNFLTI